MKQKAALLGAAALVLLSACGTMADEYAGGAIKSVEMDGKEVLTDANGMTLYTFDRDTAGVSNCYDDCAVNWPPALAADDATPEGDYTLVERTDGTKMWAYKGKPLYLYAKDTQAGDTTGDGVGGVWHTALEE